MTILYIFASVLVISLISLVGILALVLKRDLLQKSTFILVSLAVGALLGDAFIHIIPEAFESMGNPTTVSILIISGILIFFVFEKILHWHHHTLDHAENHPHPVGKMILFGDGVHNLIDGIIVAASYYVSTEIGIATTIAVVLHEIPQEIGNFGVLIHSGYSKLKALWYNFVSALTAIIGAVIVIVLGNTTVEWVSWLLPLSAGGFIYIAMSDLIPELQKEKGGSPIVQIISILVGIALMGLLLLLE